MLDIVFNNKINVLSITFRIDKSHFLSFIETYLYYDFDNGNILLLPGNNEMTVFVIINITI